MATEPPVCFRPEGAHRELIAALKATEGLSSSDVVRWGLDLLSAVQARSCAPLYALSVDDPKVENAVEEAVSAACDVLDALFEGQGSPETRGISSNFQGLLGDHIRAMLTGKEHAGKSHSTHLIPLLASWDSFGRHVYSKEGKQGITIMRPAQRIAEADTFLGDRGMVPLEKLEPGELFTSSEAAVKGYLEYLRRREESPQDHPARLVVVDFSDEAALQVLR